MKEAPSAFGVSVQIAICVRKAVRYWRSWLMGKVQKGKPLEQHCINIKHFEFKIEEYR